MERCFACDTGLIGRPCVLVTRDGQTVHVGKGCFSQARAAGSKGWQPRKGGPRLFVPSSSHPSQMYRTQGE